MATGVYHKLNVLKFRIASAFIEQDVRILTCPEIAEYIGIPAMHVAKAMNKWLKRGVTYFTRLKKKGGHQGKAYRYRINNSMIKYYKRYVTRIKLGLDLDLRSDTPKQMETFKGIRKIEFNTIQDYKVTPEELAPYIGIRKSGAIEQGITEDTKLRNAGLV